MNKIGDRRNPYTSHFYMEAVLIFVAFYLQNRPRLIVSSLNVDEILSWDLQTGSWLHLIQGIYNDTQQVLYYAIVKVLLCFAPITTDYSVRVPSLLFAGGAVAITYLYIRLYFSWQTSFIFALTSITHPLLSYVATYNRPYSLLLLFMCINLIAIQKILYDGHGGNGRKWIVIVSAIGVAFTHYMGLFYLLSVFIGIAYSSGFKSVLFILNSVPKIIVSSIAAIILTVCLSHQFQFHTYISWVFNDTYNFFDSLSMATGLGGIFLPIGLFRARNFRQLAQSEKMLLVGFSCSALLLLISKLWVAQYMLILTPFSFFLSSRYLEQTLTYMQRSSLKKYVLCFAFGVLVFMNPIFMKYVMPKAALPYAYQNFFQTFRTGTYVGFKNLLKEMKDENLISPQIKVLCITDTVRYPEKPLELYSKMYWGRDICTTYAKDLSDDQILSNYHYLIHLRYTSAETFEKIPGAMNTNQSPMILVKQHDNYELFKIKSTTLPSGL